MLILDGIEIQFSERIQHVLCDGEGIFILLDIPPKKEFVYDDFHNVFCYSICGKMLWQIGMRPNGDDAVYTMINLDSTYLYANDFLGRRYYINKNTGSIENIVITK